MEKISWCKTMAGIYFRLDLFHLAVVLYRKYPCLKMNISTLNANVCICLNTAFLFNLQNFAAG